MPALAIRFNAEADSLNSSLLGPDAKPGAPEFDLFVREVHRETESLGRVDVAAHTRQPTIAA